MSELSIKNGTMTDGGSSPDDVTVIYVNYKSGGVLKKSLKSLEAFYGCDRIEVVVVDNGSGDNSPTELKSEFPWIRIIETGRNLGFAKACNIGIRRSERAFVLLLNPDTLLAEDLIAPLLDVMDRRPNAGIVGPKLVDPDGALQLPCRRNIPTPFSSFASLFGLAKFLPALRKANAYEMPDKDFQDVTPAGSVSGAAMLIRRKVLDETGLMDENFFLYGEDLDICLRASQAGFEVLYHPGVRLVHIRGHSRLAKSALSIISGHRAMALFFDKHYAAESSFPTRFIIQTGIYARMFCMLFLAKVFRKKRAYFIKAWNEEDS